MTEPINMAYGTGNDARRIAELEAQVERLEQRVTELEEGQREAYGAGWVDGRNSTSVTGDWTYEYEAWAALEAGKQDE